MPITFIDIERRKTWRIYLFFLVLLLVYIGVILSISLFFLGITLAFTPKMLVFTILASIMAAGIHFWFSAYNTVDSVVRILSAQPPDPTDEIHKVFLNIVEEIHVVTGGKRTIRPAVIPSLSLNALAAADLKGNALIAITEGLLSRLTRPQIEAVVAHEAHHVLSGDCLETTVAASLFGTFSAAVERVSFISRNRVLSVPAFVFAWLLLQTAYLVNMLISREREYRADAASVRMTRNPVALAEALHLLFRSWRGAGFIGSGLEMLCIVNPKTTALDETDGFLADLLSTHPPLRKRIDILLRMARVSIQELDAKANRRFGEKHAVAAPLYHAQNPQQQWEGPFTLAELAAMPWFGPLTWVVSANSPAAERAWKNPDINAIFLSRLNKEQRVQQDMICPACGQPLVLSAYEGTQVSQCRFCAGILVDTDKIYRIIARTGRQQPCTHRIESLARALLQKNYGVSMERALRNTSKNTAPLIPCPKCKNNMYRGFYSLSQPIEVDRCSFCGITWFDKNELEMLQCIIANRLTSSAESGITGAEQ